MKKRNWRYLATRYRMQKEGWLEADGRAVSRAVADAFRRHGYFVFGNMTGTRTIGFDYARNQT